MAEASAVTGSSGLNIEAAVTHLNGAAGDHSSGRCARYVREAIQAGGVTIQPHPRDAKDYGPYLVSSRFAQVAAEGYTPQAGDVVVIQPYTGGSPAGHIAMYNGTQWVSDFTQRDMWSGPGYRTHQPAYVIYRP